jgi:hypothetical protein
MDHINPTLSTEPSPPILQIYGQVEQHHEAFIVGNKEGLIMLREAIDKALNEQVSFATEYVVDGEGYDIIVINRNEHWQDEPWQSLRLPYTADYYHYAIHRHPHELMTDEQRQAYIAHARGENKQGSDNP